VSQEKVMGVRPQCLIKMDSLLRNMNEAAERVAQFILKNPHLVIGMSISEVAEQSGVSESTVFRLCRNLDFGGFRQFKTALTHDMAIAPQKKHDPVYESDDARSIAEKVVKITSRSLEETLQTLDYDELEKAYNAILNARKVLVVAISVSRSLADIAADKLSFFGIDAQACKDGILQGMRAALLTQNDVVLSFSRSGDSRDIIETVKAAKNKGATTIGITNSPRSYFAKIVDICIVVSSWDERFHDDLLSSRFEHMIVVDILYNMLAVRNSDRAEAYHRAVYDEAISKQY